MPTNTYTPIGSVTLATATSEVTFTVPTGYRDLIIVTNGTTSNSSVELAAQFNGDTGSNYTFVRMWGENSSGSSNSGTTSRISMGDIPNTNRFMNRLQIFDVSATDKHKTALVRQDYDPSGLTYNAFAIAARWANTNAITSIRIFPTAGNFATGTTFNLFGIVA